MKNPLVSIALVLAVGATSAQTLPNGVATAADKPAGLVPAAPKDMAEAEVRKVDKDAKKVTLKHGPIKNLDMPGMTMVFQVRDPALLDKLVAGEKIKFNAEQLQGAFVVTAVEKADAK